jgi:hypothetical protein
MGCVLISRLCFLFLIDVICRKEYGVCFDYWTLVFVTNRLYVICRKEYRVRFDF